MEQFVVPQFIDVEPKIIGPITVRQFIIMVVALLLMFIEYKLFDFTAFLFLAVLTLVIFGTVAFLRVNGQPFHYFFLNIVQTWQRPKLRVWRKELTAAELKQLSAAPAVKAVVGQLSTRQPVTTSRLEELSLVVNTGGAYRPTAEDIFYEESKK